MKKKKPAAFCGLRGLVFGRQHKRQYAGRFLGVGGIFGSVLERLIVVVDLPEECVSRLLKATEIVLSVRVVILCEGVERADTTECLLLNGFR